MSPSPVARIALDFVEEVSTARSAAEVQSLLLSYAQSRGFEYLMICDLPVPGQTFSIIACNWPRAWLEAFSTGLYRHSPIVRHAGQTTEPFSWSDVEWDRSRGSPERRVMDLAAAHGLKDGFVVPVIGTDGEQSCVGLAGSRTALQDQERRALHLMCLYAHHAMRTTKKRRIRHRIPGPKSRDCLSYALLGLDAEAIADRTSLSSAQVRAIQRDAEKMLGASGPVESAVKAAMLGAIHP